MQKKMRGSIEDDIIGISKQKKLKKPTSTNKKTTTKGKVDVGLQKALKNKKKKSSGGGQGQSSGNIYLRTGRNQSTTYLGGKGDARTVKPYKFDKDGVKPIGGSKNKKTDNKDKTGQAPTKKGKVKATAANTKNYASTLAMQKRLKKLGANINADGIMGPKTRAAMKKFITNPSTLKKKVMVDDFKKSKVKKSASKTGIDGAATTKKKSSKTGYGSKSMSTKTPNTYRGTNITPTKLQRERMRKRMMGST